MTPEDHTDVTGPADGQRCPTCGGDRHRRPCTTGRMWGSPGADEPSHIEWCTGRQLVKAWLEERVTRRGKRKPHRRTLRLRWRRRDYWLPWGRYFDEEPF